MPMTETAAQILLNHGGRTTRQRQLVLEALMREENDVTAQALHERLRKSVPEIGLATVYRNLNALAEAGIIDVLTHGTSTCYRYCAPGHHHHIRCTNCHRVMDIRDCQIDVWAKRVASELGFRDVEHTVELVGLCGRC